MTMRQHMLDKCPVSDYAEVRQIIQEDLGAPPEQLFKQFSETPIASASLAQVSQRPVLLGRPKPSKTLGERNSSRSRLPLIGMAWNCSVRGHQVLFVIMTRSTCQAHQNDLVACN
jgi:hypothetical protein